MELQTSSEDWPRSLRPDSDRAARLGNMETLPCTLPGSAVGYGARMAYWPRAGRHRERADGDPLSPRQPLKSWRFCVHLGPERVKTQRPGLINKMSLFAFRISIHQLANKPALHYYKCVKTLVLIDSNAIVHRAYHALPKNLSNKRGELTNVTYGFALALIKILEELHPDYIAASFDLAAPTFRHIEYKEYKATRVKADQELYDQIPRVKEMLEAFGIPIYAIEGYEADDVIGTIVNFCDGHNAKCQVPDKDGLMVYIASGDRDVYQLLNGHVRVLMLHHGFSEAEIVDSARIQEKYNLQPSDFIDLKALMGDASDNIPGIPGVGPKTATDLIQKFDTLEKLYKAIEEKIKEYQVLGSKYQAEEKTLNTLYLLLDTKQRQDLSKEIGIKERILSLLCEHKDQAFKSQMLATIRRDVPIEFDLESAKWGQYDREKVRELFEELEFKSLLRRFSKDYEEAEGRKPEAEGKKVTEEQKKKDEQLRLEL